MAAFSKWQFVARSKPTESIILSLADGIDPATPIGDVLNQPIQITAAEMKGNQVRLVIDAPDGIHIHVG